MTPEITPVAMVEVEGAYIPQEAQGETGLQMRRLLLGGLWAPAPTVRVELTLNAAAGEKVPLLWDAQIQTLHRWGDLRFGYGQTPLLPSVQQPRDANPVPELSAVALALWPGRDVLAQAHLAPPGAPVEAWVALGNGSGGIYGNDNPSPAGQIRLDAVVGRGRPGESRAQPWGLRIGAGAHTDRTEDRAGVTATLPTGFPAWRPPTVSGRVTTTEAHLLALAGPVQITVEAGRATEGRSLDTDGNPDTPRSPLPTTRTDGICAELAWMITGQRRLPGDWPIDGGRPGVELSARAQRLQLGRAAADVPDGGLSGLEGTLHLWTPTGLGAAATAGAFAYDTPPLEDPLATRAWFGALRASARWR